MDLLGGLAFLKDIVLHVFKVKSERQAKLEEMLHLVRRYKQDIEGHVQYLDPNLTTTCLSCDVNDTSRKRQ